MIPGLFHLHPSLLANYMPPGGSILPPPVPLPGAPVPLPGAPSILPSPGQGAAVAPPAKNRVYVGSIEWDLTEQEITDVFSVCGKVLNCNLMVSFLFFHFSFFIFHFSFFIFHFSFFIFHFSFFIFHFSFFF